MKANAGVKIGLHNKFEFEIRDVKTNELKQSAIAYNIILDSMWSRLVSRQTFMSHIHMGTGSGTLDPARTSLFNFTFARVVTLDATSDIIDNMFRRVKIQIEPSEYVNTTFTEVGVAYGTATTSLLTHAMLEDSEGNPIAITKTDTDVLIIYATIYFTLGTLPEHVKLTGIPYNHVSMDNSLLTYLINGGTSSISTDISVGTYADNMNDFLRTPIIGNTIGSQSSALTADGSNKRIICPARRFEVAQANGHIQEVSIANSFNIQLPNVNYPGTQYNDILLSGQDGLKEFFVLPSQNIDGSSITVKINNIETSFDLITLPFYKRQNLTDLHVSGGSHYNLVIAQDGSIVRPSSGRKPLVFKNLDGTMEVVEIDKVFSYLSFLAPIFITEHFMITYTNNRLYCIDLDTLTAHEVYYQAASGHKIAQLTKDIYIVYSASQLARIWSTKDNGETWQSLVLDWQDGQAGPMFTCAATKPMLSVMPYESGVPFNVFQFNLNDNELIPITISNKTSHRIASFSRDANLIVSYSGIPGAAVYIETETGWEQSTNLIPNLDQPTAYTGCTFIDNDTLVLYNTELASCWKKLDNVWHSIYIDNSLDTLCDYTLRTINNDTYSSTFSYSGHICVLDGKTAPYVPIIGHNSPGKYAIKFATPPTAEDVITVSYKVNGIHKTSNYVLDVSGYIEFGEGAPLWL